MKAHLTVLVSCFLISFNLISQSQLIVSKSPNPSSSENSFETTDKIYCKLICEKNIKEYKLFDEIGYKSSHIADGYYVVAYIDDFRDSEKNVSNKQYKTVNYENSDKLLDKNTFEFTLNVSNPDNDKMLKESQAEFNAVLNGLSEGKHKMKLVVWARKFTHLSKKPIAVAEFELYKKAGSSMKLGTSFDDVVAKMKDPKLEAEAMKAITEFYTEFTLISKGAKPLKLKIVDENWTMMNSKSGVLVGRQIHVKVLVKNTDGSCKIVLYPLDQQYNGKGFQENFTKAIASSPYYEQGSEVADCD